MAPLKMASSTRGASIQPEMMSIKFKVSGPESSPNIKIFHSSITGKIIIIIMSNSRHPTLATAAQRYNCFLEKPSPN